MRNKGQRITGTNSLLVRIGILLAILLVFILGAVYWYFTGFYIRTYRENRFYFNQVSLENVQKSIQDQLRELNLRMGRFFEDAAVNRFIVSGKDYADADMLSSAMVLMQWAEGDKDVLDAHMLVPDSGIIVQSDRIVTTLDDYRESFRFEEALANPVTMGKPVVQGENLRLCIGFPEKRPLAVLSVTLDTTELPDAVKDISGRSTVWPVYIYDRKGQPVFDGLVSYPDFPSEALETEVEGPGYICYHLTEDPHTLVMKTWSEESGLFIISAIRDEQMLPPGLTVFAKAFPILIVLLMAILLISFLLIFQIFPPLMRLKRTLEKRMAGSQGGVRSRRGNELDYLRQAIEQNDREREQLKKLLDISSGEVVEKLFELTMNGKPEASGEWFSLLRNMDHPFTHEGKYVMILTRWQNEKETQNKRSLSLQTFDIRQQIADFWGAKCSLQMFPGENFSQGVVLRYPEQTAPARIRRDLELFDTVMKNNIARNENLVWGWGSVADSLEDVSRTRPEAEEAMEQSAGIRMQRDASEAEESGRKEQYRYVERAQKYIQENFSDSMLSLDVVSDYLGISSPYLSGLMTRYLAMGFTEFLSRYRVEKARERLADSDDSVTEIGEKTGFSSIQNFGRVFKKYTGESAGQYRKRVREERDLSRSGETAAGEKDVEG